MAWTWVRPADPAVLAGRPLLDLGTGDGQTLDALAPTGFVVGIDRRLNVLRPGALNAEASHLPFRDGAFATVLAADLFHHFDDAEIAGVLAEIHRVIAPGGRLVAWWYEQISDRSPDAPRHPRGVDQVLRLARGAGLDVEPLDVVSAVATSPTIAIVASR